MDYGNLIQNSLRIAAKHRSLWVFGMFAGASVGFINFNSLWDAKDAYREFPIIDNNLILIITIFVVLTILMITLNTIARPAMIDAVNKITRGGEYHFSDSFSRGLDFFKRFIALIILTLGVAIIFSGLIFMINFIFAEMGMLLMVLGSILVFPIIILITIIVYHITAMTGISMVVRDISVGDALFEGYNLFMINKGRCFMITLIYLGMSIAISIIAMFLILLTIVPAIIAFAVTDSAAVGISLGLLLGIPMILFVGGFSGTFTESLYIQFYFRLVEPPQPIEITQEPIG